VALALAEAKSLAIVADELDAFGRVGLGKKEVSWWAVAAAVAAAAAVML
jgi:hypothetical protein